MRKTVHASSAGRVLAAALLMIVACATSAIVSALLIRGANAYTDGHRRVTAQVVRVLRPPVAAARSAPLPAAVMEVVWTGRDGRTHTGRTVAASGEGPDHPLLSNTR